MASRPTRRQFLKQAAVSTLAPTLLGTAASAFAVPTVVPSTVVGSNKVKPSDQIALGFVGMGIRSNELLVGRFLKNQQCRVLGLAEVDTTRRLHFRNIVNQAYGNRDCQAVVDYSEVYARDDIDAVVIGTPDHWHAIQILHACQAGKDIYAEKPLTLTIHEAKAVVDGVRKTGRVLQTGSQQRTEYGHLFCQAVDIVRSGMIGKVMTVNVGVGDTARWCDLPGETPEPGLDWDRWLGPAPMREYNTVLSPRGIIDHYPMWRLYREYSGGYVTDMGAHHFDIAQWGLNRDDSGPVEVVPAREDETRGVTLIYEDGVKITHGGPSGTTFVGSDGIVHIDRGRLVTMPDDLKTRPLPEGFAAQPRPATHEQDWLDCIRTRAKPVCHEEVGARSVTACHLVNLAYWHGKRFAWDPEKWTFADRTGDQKWLDMPRREGYELPKI